MRQGRDTKAAYGKNPENETKGVTRFPMKDTLTNIPKHLRLYTAALALAALVIAVAAVTLTAGPTQAQGVVEPFSRLQQQDQE